MKWIIDIPESTIIDLKKKPNRTEVDVAVLNGTPLPKGHSDLIDRDELRETFAQKCVTDCGCCDGADECHLLLDAPTIIEADKEQTE